MNRIILEKYSLHTSPVADQMHIHEVFYCDSNLVNSISLVSDVFVIHFTESYS